MISEIKMKDNLMENDSVIKTNVAHFLSKKLRRKAFIFIYTY